MSFLFSKPMPAGLNCCLRCSALGVLWCKKPSRTLSLVGSRVNWSNFLIILSEFSLSTRKTKSCFVLVHLPNEWATCSPQGPDLPKTASSICLWRSPLDSVFLFRLFPGSQIILLCALDLISAPIYTTRPGQWIVSIAYAQMWWFSNSSEIPPDVHTFPPAPAHAPPLKKQTLNHC